MKQENFLFVDVVSSIFLLVLMVGNMMGLLYITDGNFLISILISLFIVVCYYFIVQMLKKNKEVMANKSYMVPQSLFFLVFLIFGALSFVLMSHFLNIEMNAKPQIQVEADQKIKKVNELGTVYDQRSEEDLQNFEGELTGKLKAYKNTKNNQLRNELSLEPYSIDEQVLAAPQFIDVPAIVDSKLQPYRVKIIAGQKMVHQLNKGAASYKSTFDNWDRMALVSAYRNLNQYITDSYAKVNSKVKELPLDKTPIRLEMSQKQLPLNSPLELNKIYSLNYLIPGLLVLFTHLFILIPFFTYKVRKYIKTKDNLTTNKGTIEL